MKRNRLSGAAYKKIAIQKKDKIASVIAETKKINQFFTSLDTPSKYER